MNWFKKAQHSISDWKFIYNKLEESLGRKPSNDEVQKELVKNLFDDNYKKDYYKNHKPESVFM